MQHYTGFTTKGSFRPYGEQDGFVGDHYYEITYSLTWNNDLVLDYVTVRDSFTGSRDRGRIICDGVDWHYRRDTPEMDLVRTYMQVHRMELIAQAQAAEHPANRVQSTKVEPFHKRR